MASCTRAFQGRRMALPRQEREKGQDHQRREQSTGLPAQRPLGKRPLGNPRGCRLPGDWDTIPWFWSGMHDRHSEPTADLLPSGFLLPTEARGVPRLSPMWKFSSAPLQEGEPAPSPDTPRGCCRPSHALSRGGSSSSPISRVLPGPLVPFRSRRPGSAAPAAPSPAAAPTRPLLPGQRRESSCSAPGESSSQPVWKKPASRGDPVPCRDPARDAAPPPAPSRLAGSRERPPRPGHLGCRDWAFHPSLLNSN